MNLVVGIPTKNESRTIAAVAAIADLGLRTHFPNDRIFIINADNGSTDGTQDAFMSVPTIAQKLTINTGAVATGKGSNVFAIMEAARSLNADALALIDGDLQSVEPQWIKALLVNALGSATPTFVTPEYSRSRYEANSTNQLVRPYLRAAFGLDVRQPIGGEFAMNASFIDEALRWARSESTNLYGIDVWLTANTALQGFELRQVEIGRKVHNPTFPKIYKLGQQVLDALFRLMLENRPARPNTATATSAGLQIDAEGKPLPMKLVKPVVGRSADYLHNRWDELVFTFPALIAQPRPAEGKLPRIDTAMWCEILCDAYAQLDATNFRDVRDRIVGLFPARVVTYWSEIQGMQPHEVDALLDGQSRTLAEMFASRAMPDTAVDLSHDIALRAGHWSDAPVETPIPL